MILQESLREPLLQEGSRRAEVPKQPSCERIPSKATNGDVSPAMRRLTSSSSRHSDPKEGGRSWNLRMFPDREALKHELKSRLFVDSDGVTREQALYRDDGFFPDLARSKSLETVTFTMIIMNTFWIGIDADYNHTQLLVDADPIFQVMENVFCVFFVFEICVRFLALQNRQDCIGDKWFVFDAVLVLLMVWDTWIITGIHVLSGGRITQTSNAQALRVFRLLRLTRVARVGRLMRSVPEFGILVKGVWMAMRSVFSTLCLMALIMYVYAIVFTELLHGSEHVGCFSSVFSSMNCLLLQGVFADQAQIMQAMLDTGLVYYLLILTFLVIASMTVLNMLIGVMCELIGSTAECEREALALNKVRENVKAILPDLDSDGDGMISEDEFVKILESEEAVRALSEVDVDVVALVDFSDYIFKGRDQLDFTEFMATVARFRGGQSVVLKDLVDVREFLSGEIRNAVKTMAAATANLGQQRLSSSDDERFSPAPVLPPGIR